MSSHVYFLKVSFDIIMRWKYTETTRGLHQFRLTEPLGFAPNQYVSIHDEQ